MQLASDAISTAVGFASRLGGGGRVVQSLLDAGKFRRLAWCSGLLRAEWIPDYVNPAAATDATFFRRRALRLLPAFYIAVLGALVFNLPGMRDSWPWHVLQASNFYFAFNNSWATPWPANHLWSLNVEEQFYVIWPLVLLLPRIWLPWVIGCFIMAAPIFRNLAPGVWAETMPIASFDALAGGGLMALFPRRTFYLGFAAAPVVLWGLISVAEWDGIFAAASVLFAFAVVLAAYNGALTLFDRPEIIWLGRISYGVYLYHLFVWAGIRALGWGASPGWKTMLACSGATIMVAAPSYYFLERPILRKFGSTRRGWSRQG